MWLLNTCLCPIFSQVKEVDTVVEVYKVLNSTEVFRVARAFVGLAVLVTRKSGQQAARHFVHTPWYDGHLKDLLLALGVSWLWDVFVN